MTKEQIFTIIKDILIKKYGIDCDIKHETLLSDFDFDDSDIFDLLLELKDKIKFPKITTVGQIVDSVFNKIQ